MKKLFIVLVLSILGFSQVALALSPDQLPDDIFVNDPAYTELRVCLQDPPNGRETICLEGFFKNVEKIESEAEILFFLDNVCIYQGDYGRACIRVFSSRVDTESCNKIQDENLRHYCLYPVAGGSVMREWLTSEQEGIKKKQEYQTMIKKEQRYFNIGVVIIFVGIMILILFHKRKSKNFKTFRVAYPFAFIGMLMFAVAHIALFYDSYSSLALFKLATLPLSLLCFDSCSTSAGLFTLLLVSLEYFLIGWSIVSIIRGKKKTIPITILIVMFGSMAAILCFLFFVYGPAISGS
jgi:hypothetical protein